MTAETGIVLSGFVLAVVVFPMEWLAVEVTA